VIMYADTMTRSMKAAIDETNRRRKMQIEYNQAHGITPKTIKKAIPESMSEEMQKQKEDIENIEAQIAEKAKSLDSEIEIAELIRTLEMQMLEFAAALKFEQAAYLRDKIRDLKATYLGQGKKK
ncbi:MAG: UvrB/UvrC motif-containing protein, partial [Candidatus Sigynarchaeum springense]